MTDHQLDQVEAGGWVEVSKTDGSKEIVKIITEASVGRVAVSQELSWWRVRGMTVGERGGWGGAAGEGGGCYRFLLYIFTDALTCDRRKARAAPSFYLLKQVSQAGSEWRSYCAVLGLC